MNPLDTLATLASDALRAAAAGEPEAAQVNVDRLPAVVAEIETNVTNGE